MGFLDFLFGGKKATIQNFIKRDAIIVDVRTEKEYYQGAIKGSKNFPLQSLKNNIGYLRSLNKPIITCCASGIRSGAASKLLKRYGIEVINGGGWQSLSEKL